MERTWTLEPGTPGFGLEFWHTTVWASKSYLSFLYSSRLSMCHRGTAVLLSVKAGAGTGCSQPYPVSTV